MLTGQAPAARGVFRPVPAFDRKAPYLSCLVEIDGLDIRIDHDGDDPAAELEKIVAGMTAATWEDPGTWYDVDEALP